MDRLLLNTTDFLQKILFSNSYFSKIDPVYFKYLQFLPIVIIGFVITLLLSPILGKLAFKYGITDNPPALRKRSLNRFDDPDRHIHKKRVPLLGGLAVLLPLAISLPLFIQFDSVIWPLYISFLILIITGFLDDKYNLPAHFQLILHTLAGIIILFSIIDLPFINNPLGGQIDLNWYEHTFNFLGLLWRVIIPGDLLIIPWIILCINAVKWTGGSDGLMDANMIITFTLIAILGFRANEALIVIISLLTVGSLLGFFIFQFPPAKMFSGSIGKTTYGFLVATLALVKGAKVATTILILALPIIDALFVVIIRYLKYKPKNIIDLFRINDTNHLHHQFIKMNFSPLKIILIETSITLFLGSIAILTTGAYKLFAIILTLFLVSSGILYTHLKAEKGKELKIKETSKKSPESKYSY